MKFYLIDVTVFKIVFLIALIILLIALITKLMILDQTIDLMGIF